jgi:NAD(P)-dependent dehydrogenase (short-subunit alcohol dehydrogenase family)
LEPVTGRLDGKVAIVSGAGRGIGRGEALALAAEGAAVVVNDLGGSLAGGGQTSEPAIAVCEEIAALGGNAVANFDNVADPAGAERLVRQAVDTFGRLDVLVNNAGILRDGMVFSADPDEWWSVVEVHLKGHFLPTHFATAHWRRRSKEGDLGRRTIVNTSSESGLFGNAGQTNYDAAKMGIAGFTIAVARECGKYGVTCNAIAPRARTRMTSSTFEGTTRGSEFSAVEEGFDAMDPDNVGPFVAFLATDEAAHITAQTFVVWGGIVAHVRMPHVGDVVQTKGRWTVDELVERQHELFALVGCDVLEGPRGFAKLPRQE